MTILERYNSIFKECFSNQLTDLVWEDLKYQSIKEWDSVGHMRLVSAIEEEFNITLQPDDIVKFVSYSGGKDILARYGVEIK